MGMWTYTRVPIKTKLQVNFKPMELHAILECQHPGCIIKNTEGCMTDISHICLKWTAWLKDPGPLPLLQGPSGCYYLSLSFLPPSMSKTCSLYYKIVRLSPAWKKPYLKWLAIIGTSYMNWCLIYHVSIMLAYCFSHFLISLDVLFG